MKKQLLFVAVLILSVAKIYAQNVPSYVPTNGLVGWWPFNGNANDESGNGNNGTVNGASLSADRNGKANSAYSFDGTNNYIELSQPFLQGNQNVGSFTVSYWLNLSKLPTSDILTWGQSSYWRSHWNSINPSGEMFFGGENVSDYYGLTTPSGKLTVGNWHNVIEIYNGTTLAVYIDNILISSTTISFSSLNFSIIVSGNSTGKKLFGCASTQSLGLYAFFNGKLDDFCFWNRALSQQEIAQIYAGCSKEIATSSNFNSVIYTTTAALNLNANPSGGTFSGDAVVSNSFNPSKAKLGKNTVKYNFKNTTGCVDSTNFVMILVDTLGNKCSTYDTLKIKMKLTTGIKAGQQTSMNIYPNPTSDKLIIETNDIQAISGYKYKILDIQGKEVYNALATSAKTEISLKSIGAKGMYILHIVDEKGVSIENKKIVLE